MSRRLKVVFILFFTTFWLAPIVLVGYLTGMDKWTVLFVAFALCWNDVDNRLQQRTRAELVKQGLSLEDE